MDCIRTQAAISALHDKEPVTEENVEAVRAHLAECESCRSFEADLSALDALPMPTTPPELVTDIMAAVRAIADERAEEQAAPDPDEPTEEPTEPTPATPRFTWLQGRARWGAYAAVVTAAAAVVLVVVIVSGRPGPQTASVTQPSDGGSGLGLALSGAPVEKAPTAGAPAPTPAPARAPDYVVFRNRVYAPGALLAASIVATPSIGTLTTAFNGGAAPAPVSVLRSPVTDGSIVVPGPDGQRIYAPVVRMFASVKYQMVAGKSIDRFGQWPELPSRFLPPTSPDGSPTFTLASGDALGVQAYTAAGIPAGQGLAVAPGTSGTDPAASNPNWTWWEPMQMP